MFQVTGLMFYGFAVVDFSGMFFGNDLAGVSWSPPVARGVGSVLYCGSDDDE